MLERPLASLALLAVASLFAGTGCGEAKGCTMMDVPDRAYAKRTVTLTFDDAKPLHVELCFRDSCQSEDFVATGAARASRLCGTTGDPLYDGGCSFHRDESGSWIFEVRWDVSNYDPQNGDRYRAKLTAAEGTLVDIDTRATYEESEPNGEGCGITKSATL